MAEKPTIGGLFDPDGDDPVENIFPRRASSVDDFLDALEDADAIKDLPPKKLTEELVVQANGEVRQAGADAGSSALVNGIKDEAERSLYFFTKAILGRSYLSKSLHGERVCPWLTRNPPRRKLLLIPRQHCKSTLVSQSMPLHILIQRPETNIYFPGEWGTEQRILMIGEADRVVRDHMSTMRAALEGASKLLCAFWPHIVWERPKRDAPRWNNDEFIVPRQTHFPDPSVRAVGVTGRITGAHPTVLIKDDLIAKEAANSPAIMTAAIDAHKVSRAFINRDEDLEFIIGTKWAADDLYNEIIDEDATVESMVMGAIENGRPIYPEAFTLEKLAQIKSNMPATMFSLLFMNSVEDESLTDFATMPKRFYQLDGDQVIIEEDVRDHKLYEMFGSPRLPSIAPGARLKDVYKTLSRDVEFFS